MLQKKLSALFGRLHSIYRLLHFVSFEREQRIALVFSDHGLAARQKFTSAYAANAGEFPAYHLAA